MADSDALAYILDSAPERAVPHILSVDGRAVAYAIAPDYELVRLREPLPTTEDMLRALLAIPPGPGPADPEELWPPASS